jgi:hypothetical protein
MQANILFSTERGMSIMNYVQIYSYISESYKQLKRVEFGSDGLSYILLRGPWCAIIVLNVHAPTEDKTDDMKDSYYEELESVFDKFHKHHKNFC